TAPTGQARQEALGVLEGLALYDGAEKKVCVRVGETENAIYIDLADDARQIVEVTPLGWRILVDAPVVFARPKGMLPLPAPVSGGDVAELRPFINVADDQHFVLVVAWIIAAMKPRGPFPILTLVAEH